MLELEVHRAGVRREDQCKMEEIKAGTPQGWTDGYSSVGRFESFLLSPNLMGQMSCKSQPLPHEAEHIHLTQESKKLKGNPREGGLVAGPYAHSGQQGER